MSEHALGPYAVASAEWDGTCYWTVVDHDDKVICMEPTEFFAYPEGPFIEPGGERANAEFIVLACNAHEDLLEACRQMAIEAGRDGVLRDVEGYRVLVENYVLPAIAKAEGK